MLTLTRKTDYALIALVHLARETQTCCSAREIAMRYHLPLPLLMNLLKLLAQKGLTKSVRGPRGGYTLAQPPDRITLNDVICAVEGPSQLVLCVEHAADKNGHAAPQFEKESQECDLVGCCPVRSPIARIHDRLVEFLSSVTLADIVGQGAEQAVSASAAPEQLVQITLP